jgi:hypothetical protein
MAMVIIRMTGGLGNQMFQYAAGRAASLQNDSSLVLDTYFYGIKEGKVAHEKELALNVFPEIEKQKLTSINNQISIDIHAAGHSRIQRAYNRIRRYIGLQPTYKKFEEQQLLTYEPAFHKQKANTLYLAGDWQNELYFNSYREIIRKDFTFPTLALNSINGQLLSTITTHNAVSIHVRRGDYISSATHMPTSEDYYKQAVAFILNKVSNPVFFVFSDDIEWCKKNLNLPNSYFISHNTGGDSYIDMQLMSNCKHNIIANSSFSWWGAWLNNKPEKIIIAPKIWLKKLNVESSNVIPSSWVII